MAINYKRMQTTATRLITQNGAVYEATRGGGVHVAAGVEVNTPPEKFDVIGIVSNYEPDEIDGSLIQSGDIKMSVTAEVEIRIGDRITIDNALYRIVKPNPVKPASVLICYKPQLRA